MADKAWLVAVNMGYGHQRTAYPLRNLAFEGKIINANDYDRIPEKDRKIWEASRRFYEFISNFKRIPLLGNFSFSLYDKFQKILTFYPKKDLFQPNFALKQIYSLLKKGWGRNLITELKAQSSKLKTNLPIVTTFFTSAFMAEFFNYPGEVFCIVCDADISRAWAPLNPRESKIKYFAPTGRVVERLKSYGIKEVNIFLTGYPLPKELIGGESMETLKGDLRNRLFNLDLEKRYLNKYKTLVEEKLGELPQSSNHPLTIMFSVGGAGVQKEIGSKILRSLKEKIKNGEIKIILSAGTKERVKTYFEKEIDRGQFSADLVGIIFGENIEDYFQKFNQALRKTDILWTKPSEISFYAALGIPIIIAPAIGSQEEFNMRWLLKSGFGMLQENPNYTDQWLFDWISQGYLAEAATQGFVEGEKMGTFNIKKIIEKCPG